MQVEKRDGSVVDWDENRILRAVSHEARTDLTPELVLRHVQEELVGMDTVSVEDIQDAVETALMELGEFDHAKHYITYRASHEKQREVRREPDQSAIADYTHVSKYARYVRSLKRRETWPETVLRLKSMHMKRFPQTRDEIEEVFDKFVLPKIVMPSARSLQFGGEAIERNHVRMYNCSFTHADRPEFFGQMFFLLLSGAGCGFSVQRQHVAKLPSLGHIDQGNINSIQIQDTIEGWGDALSTLIASYMQWPAHPYVEFQYDWIRPMGADLRVSGGKAPGHIPLKQMLETVRAKLDAASGRRLKPIEVHDICCFVSEAVLAGGVRRSSMISLFSPDDFEMLDSKTGNWFDTNPQRMMANNSAVFLRSEADFDQFAEIFRRIREFGEPGFFFTNNLDHGCNPCGEIGLNPIAGVGHSKETGWGFCNLTEINCTKVDTGDAFLDACQAAAFIGTLQAAYDTFPYLGSATEQTVMAEALLGVGLTGMMDNPMVFDPELQQAGAKAVVAENKRVAPFFGIEEAKRCTTVKPSGTLSLLLGAVGSGIHPHHARRYFRRITANKIEVPFQFFKDVNPHMCEEKPNGDWVVTFPVEAPSDAVIRHDIGAIDFMKKILSTYENWVLPGTAEPDGLTHNVSCTVTVRDGEWHKVCLFAWENRHRIAAMAFLSDKGDKIYSFAPREEVITEADEAKWNALIRDYVPIDWSKAEELSDGTTLVANGQCDGPKCEANLR